MLRVTGNPEQVCRRVILLFGGTGIFLFLLISLQNMG